MFDQFYHTRCSSAESVIGQDEFSIRASSLGAEEIRTRRLQATLYKPAYYELPPSLLDRTRRGEVLDAEDAPIRLARMLADNDQLAVIHSVYRDDAGARRGNYFSHVVLPKDGSLPLSAGAAITLWGLQSRWGGATGWVWRDEKLGGDPQAKSLPAWSPPTDRSGVILTCGALRHFLVGEAVPASPAIDVFPRRLMGVQNKEFRRLLVELTVASFLDGKQCQLIAEPGLAALLIFALTALLPGAVTDGLTFSTYEPPKRCLEGKFQVVNAVSDAADELRTQLRRNPGAAVLLDTFDFARLPSVRVSDDAMAYARQALDHFLDPSGHGLQSYWTTCGRILGGSSPDGKQLCDFAGRYQRLLAFVEDPARTDVSPLEPYAESPGWRQLLVGFRHGPARLVALATAHRPQRPAWWPVNETDTGHRQTLEPKLTEFRDLILDRIVAGLAGTSTTDVGFWCLSNLLPGVLEASFDIQEAELTVVRKLGASSGTAGKPGLPWATRGWGLERLCDSGFVGGYGNDLPALWLEVTSFEELDALLRMKNLRLLWKAEATVKYLVCSDADDTKLAARFAKYPDFLRAAMDRFKFAANGDDILVRLFRSLPVPERFRFLATLVRVVNSDQESEAELVRACLGSLLLVEGPWHFLVADDDQVTRLVTLLGQDSVLLSGFWGAACRSLDVQCLFVDKPQNRVLVCLLDFYRQGKLRFASDQTRELALRLSHWRRLFTGIRDEPPDGNEWEALRWSLGGLAIPDQFRVPVLSALIGSVLRTREVISGEDAAELLRCTRVLTGQEGEAWPVVRVLLEATATMAEPNRSSVQATLLSECCRGRLVWYEQLLDAQASVISDHVWTVLSRQRNALVDELRRKRRPAKWLGRIKRLLVAFGVPAALGCIWLGAVFWYVRQAAEVEIAALVAMLAGFGALGWSFFQAWRGLDLLDVSISSRRRPTKSRATGQKASAAPVAASEPRPPGAAAATPSGQGDESHEANAGMRGTSAATKRRIPPQP